MGASILSIVEISDLMVIIGSTGCGGFDLTVHVSASNRPDARQTKDLSLARQTGALLSPLIDPDPDHGRRRRPSSQTTFSCMYGYAVSGHYEHRVL
jgi:hypothetical protein